MKRMLVLSALSLALAACGPAYVSVGPTVPATPGYVYTYADGGCWADDVWYASCPWLVGPRYGYYYSYRSQWYWQPRAVWRDRRAPPPRVRPSYPPSRHDKVPPPRVRDHRRRR